MQMALIVVALGLIAGTVVRAGPIEPETASKVPTVGNALVAVNHQIEMQVRCFPRTAVFSQDAASAVPPVVAAAASPSTPVHRAMFFDFDFTAARGRSRRTARR